MTNTVGTLGTGLDVSKNPIPGGAATYVTKDGFDLIYMQELLQKQMVDVQTQIQNIQANANLSDTEKMFTMQMTMNTWSAIANLRTNMLKTVADSLKSIARNVS